jgi:hypothetical protein
MNEKTAFQTGLVHLRSFGFNDEHTHALFPHNNIQQDAITRYQKKKTTQRNHRSSEYTVVGLQIRAEQRAIGMYRRAPGRCCCTAAVWLRSRSAGIISRLKNTVDWFFVREKYCFGWKNKLNKTDYKPDEQGLRVFTSHANLKYFLFHPSHRIFECMHEALNVGKKDN